MIHSNPNQVKLFISGVSSGLAVFGCALSYSEAKKSSLFDEKLLSAVTAFGVAIGTACIFMSVINRLDGNHRIELRDGVVAMFFMIFAIILVGDIGARPPFWLAISLSLLIIIVCSIIVKSRKFIF